MVYTDEQLLKRLDDMTNLCGTMLGIALDKRGVSETLTAQTRQFIVDTYLDASDTRDARGIER